MDGDAVVTGFEGVGGSVVDESLDFEVAGEEEDVDGGFCALVESGVECFEGELVAVWAGEESGVAGDSCRLVLDGGDEPLGELVEPLCASVEVERGGFSEEWLLAHFLFSGAQVAHRFIGRSARVCARPRREHTK